ncbi:MAG: ligand-binding sensor domain-containing protein [Chloroflexota bacterium]
MNLRNLYLILSITLVLLSGCTPHASEPQWTTYTTKDGLASNQITSIVVGPDSALWFGTIRGGVSRFYSGNWTSYAINQDPSDNLNHIMTMDFDSNGTLWMGTLCAGVLSFNGESWTGYTTASTHGTLAGNCILAVKIAPDDAVWIGTEYQEVPGDSPQIVGGGVSLWDGKGWSTYMRDLSITSIVVDAKDELWFGTSAGAVRFGETSTTYLAGEHIPCLAMAPDDALWFCVDHSGVSRFNGKSWINYSSADGLASESLTSLAITSGGDIWVGTRDAGVSCFDGDTWYTYTVRDGLASNRITSIAIAPDETIWFGTWDSGVSKLAGRCGTK